MNEIERLEALEKLRKLKRELNWTAEEGRPYIRPIFVRNADVWFPPPEAQCWRAYQRWIMEQVRSE